MTTLAVLVRTMAASQWMQPPAPRPLGIADSHNNDTLRCRDVLHIPFFAKWRPGCFHRVATDLGSVLNENKAQSILKFYLTFFDKQ
mmetsp:Transcript_38720/g.74357  ORF Transcript_38720/g.74357 Transcript_38720/m.74357 type:complete len:86 (-) Transcript_38720:230-487(-)